MYARLQHYMPIRFSAVLMPVAIALFLVPASGLAAPVKREILAIYDGSKEREPSETLVHMAAEMPLNHLGYIVHFHDLRDPLPAPETMSRYAAVITWFTYNLGRPADYLSWAARVAESGVRFIVLGGIGAPATMGNLALFNRVLAPIGVRYTTDYVAATAGSAILVRDNAVVDFERALDPLLPEYPIIERISLQARVALEVQAPPRERSGRTSLVTTGPGGAFVPGAFIIYYDEALERGRWLINPFELFRRALGERVFPMPDTTTVSGRRLYFSHVDGDGWNNMVEMERYRDPPITASEVMLRELIEPYPDLPVSVGLVGGDIDPDLGGGREAADIARRIFALPQVEVASHTCTHPFIWAFYENYDRGAEERLLAAQADSPPSPPGVFGQISAAFGFAATPDSKELLRKRYLSGSRNLPRAFLRDPFSIGIEVDHSTRETAALAPPDKPVALYQWSGDTQPFEAIIRATRRAGMRNINGGDTRLDGEYPSVRYVAPLSRVVGKARQIYAVNSNENTYTNGWTGPFHGFLSLRETLERTEHPRRLKGVNVYYHTFSAEKQVSLSAIRSHLDWARAASLASIPASRYAAIADGFFSTRIDQVGETTWRISERDGMQTMRFDDANDLEVDIAHSRGVLGSTRHAGSLYIALDEVVAEAVVALRKTDAAPPPTNLRTAALEGARWLVSDLGRNRCSLSHRATGFGKGEFMWKGLPSGLYRVEVRRDTDLIWQDTRLVEHDGRLSMVIPVDAIEPVEIRIGCPAGEEVDR
jgi:hypothetical protein